MKMRSIRIFLTFLFITLAVQFTASFATIPEIKVWYRTIQKPAWTPSDYLFGPVWFVLYVLMAISGWLAFSCAAEEKNKRVVGLYALQLLFNFAWSFIFFKFHRIGLAFADIVLLWFSILIMTIQYSKINRLSGMLLIPYLLWVGFATCLNFSIWRLNS